MQESNHYSLLTMTKGAALFEEQTQAKVDRLIIELDLEDQLNLPSELSRDHKVNRIIQYAKKNPEHQTMEGSNLTDRIVEKAAELAGELKPVWKEHPAYMGFVRALNLDGFILEEEGRIRRTLPEVADLPEANNEVNVLLEALGFNTPKGHLEQAIANHSNGNWAAANSQLRTFLQSLFDEIALAVDNAKASTVQTGENRRQFLAKTEPPFLVEQLGEWSNDGKNFVNGVFKRLHAYGSHPGLSDEEDCTFRLHLVLITARHFLRRAKQSTGTA